MKWGILATGNIAHKFAATVTRMEETETVTAVASRSLERARAFAGEFGIPAAYGSYEELIRSADVEAVYVSLPNRFHGEMVRLCLENGKAVLCEKPLTNELAESEELYRLAKEKNVFLMEAFWVQFLPLYRQLRKVLSEGTVGEIRRIECEFGVLASGPRRLTKLKPELGGGALLDLGIYCIGFLQIVHPGELLYRGGTTELCEFGTDIESCLDFEWEDGCTARVLFSDKRVLPRHGRITGTKGTILLPNFQQGEAFVVVPEDSEPYIVDAPVEINGFEYEIRECSRCVAEGLISSPGHSPEDSLRLISAMEMILDRQKQ